MTHKKLSELTDSELVREAKRIRSIAIRNAVLIGFLIGIVWYSIVKNSIGIVTLIPLFFIYKLVNRPKYDSRQLEALLKERNLK